MNAVIIPQKIAQKGDLVVLPRKEYEELFRFSPQAKTDWIYEKPVVKYIKERIRAAESEFKKGKMTVWKPKLK